MPTKTVKITRDCAMVWDHWDEAPGEGSVAVRYTEHSTDHFTPNSVTEADIDAATARAIVALLVAAFGPAVLPTKED
jgi:hypothetical protein